MEIVLNVRSWASLFLRRTWWKMQCFRTTLSSWTDAKMFPQSRMDSLPWCLLTLSITESGFNQFTIHLAANSNYFPSAEKSSCQINDVCQNWLVLARKAVNTRYRKICSNRDNHGNFMIDMVDWTFAFYHKWE